MSKRKKGRKGRHRRSRNKNKSTKKPNSYREKRPQTIKERDFKSQRRRQDLIFVTVMIIVGVGLIGGYYLYETTWSTGNNNNGINDNNGLIENGNGNPSEKNEIVWEHDYEKGLELARTSNRPILIDFYTDWCVYCKDMDRNTYSDSRVIDKSTKFVCIKVDGDKRPDVRDKYLIDSYPTTMFLNNFQDEIHRMKGYIGPGQFIEDMDFALARAGI